jgi:beta-galactosidase
MWHELELSTHYGRLAGGVYRQSFIPDASEPFAFYDDGEIAGVESDFGEGKVRVIGTMAGYGYKQNPKREYLGFFSSALPFAGTRQLLRTEHNTGVIARVWANESNVYLWCLNTRNYAQRVLLAPDNERLCFSDAAPLRGGPAELRNGLLGFLAPAKDAVVYKLS